jgi:hypothetical protein
MARNLATMTDATRLGRGEARRSRLSKHLHDKYQKVLFQHLPPRLAIELGKRLTEIYEEGRVRVVTVTLDQP